MIMKNLMGAWVEVWRECCENGNPAIIMKRTGFSAKEDNSGNKRKRILFVREDRTGEVVTFKGDERSKKNYKKYIQARDNVTSFMSPSSIDVMCGRIVLGQ
jgi:hypothetical protein